MADGDLLPDSVEFFTPNFSIRRVSVASMAWQAI
jgi:hypothetical protein